MSLRYATITGVARDDLDDGGAWLYAETVRQIHALNPGTGVENLIPDFGGDPGLLREVFEFSFTEQQRRGRLALRSTQRRSENLDGLAIGNADRTDIHSYHALWDGHRIDNPELIRRRPVRW